MARLNISLPSFQVGRNFSVLPVQDCEDFMTVCFSEVVDDAECTVFPHGRWDGIHPQLYLNKAGLCPGNIIGEMLISCPGEEPNSNWFPEITILFPLSC